MDNNKIIIILSVILLIMIVAAFFLFGPSFAKKDSNVVVSSASALCDGDNFTVHLTDLNNTPIANQTVNLNIIDANGGQNNQNITTDANGDAKLQLNGLAVGNYTVNVNYGGNENFNPSNTTQSLEIKQIVVESVSGSDPHVYPSGLTDEEIEAYIQRDLDVRGQNGVKGQYDYQQARSFYENVPPSGMK